MNSITIIGNVGKDPVCKTIGTQNTLIAEFSIATSYPKRDKTWGTDWHNIKAFGKAAEYIQAKVFKGYRCFVVGEMKTESWIDKQTQQQRSKLVLNAREVMAEPREANGATNANPPASRAPAPSNPPADEFPPSDLPWGNDSEAPASGW